jgi:phage tail-like protein
MINYPLPKFHFSVDWGGTNIGFTEVTGFEITNDVIEYRDGSSPEYSMIKMPGLRKFSNITLKRGMFRSDNDFYTWFNTINMNTVQRRDITISLLDENLTPVVIWNIKNAWPCKIVSADLRSYSSEVAIESLEIAYENMTIQNN